MVLISRKYCFLAVNFLMVFCMVISITDFPLAGAVMKVKFLFIAFCIVDIALRGKKPANNHILVILLIFLFYAVVWGYVLDNSHVAVWNEEHRKIMIMYIPMLFGTVFELIAYDCIDEYILSSAAALFLVLLVQVGTHFNQLSLNPIAAIGGITGSNRIKASFGFMHVNFAGNCCFCALISLYLRNKQVSANSFFHSKKKLMIFMTEAITWFFLLSTSCRTAMLALFMYLAGDGVYKLFKSDRLTKGSKLLLVAVILVLLIVFIPASFIGGFWDYIWANSNRSLNVSENLKWVGVIGNKWTGMGYVDNQCFYRDEGAGGIGGFGVATSSLDMNYLFIYCSTGILGTILFVSMIVLTGLGIFRNVGQEKGVSYILLYLVMVFYAYWETIMFTYRFWSMIVPTSIMVYASNGVMKHEVSKVITDPPSRSYYRAVWNLQGKAFANQQVETSDY